MSNYNFRYSSEKPPMLEVCEKYFGADWNRGTVFAYGDTIHAKDLNKITMDVETHELVHLKQQKEFGDKDLWWDEYLRNPDFRIKQEVEAYKAQIKYAEIHFNRDYRRALKKHIYSSFALLSGGVITVEEAERLLI